MRLSGIPFGELKGIPIFKYEIFTYAMLESFVDFRYDID